MRHFISIAALSLLVLSACGVKAPPIAPTPDPEPVEEHYDCSPYDEKCDVKDPNYKPQGKRGR